MSVYYQDEHVTLYHGDSLEILPTLDVTADVLLTDPPYFKVKQDEWDNQWDKASEFLGWMGEWLDLTVDKLASHASVWVFASPALTSSVERLVGERFRVLNSIRWVKPTGHHLRTSLQAQRRFFPAWEGCVFAEHYSSGAAGSTRDLDFWNDAFRPLRDYLNHQREDSGLARRDIDRKWQEARGTRGAMSTHWFGDRQWALPTREQWGFLQAAGIALAPYDEIAEQYDDLRANYLQRRRPFALGSRENNTDVWHFASVPHYPGKHPCEKPQEMLSHMIAVSSRPGWTILDPFAGGGSTLLTASALGRKAIGIEKDERYCEQIATKLSTQTLDLFGDAA